MPTTFRLPAAALFAACCAGSALAQTPQVAPGEDPVVLERKVFVQGLPTAAAARSGYMSPSSDMPAWQKAKVARYEAKAFSGDTTGILTDKDVINTATSDGFKTTCTQTIGALPTTTTTVGANGKTTQQVVVLRGDLVNICN